MKSFFIFHGVLLLHAAIALWCKIHFSLSWTWPIVAIGVLVCSLFAYGMMCLLILAAFGPVIAEAGKAVERGKK